MIEDSLKTTRALHRLLLTVSLATIVFSLSLQTYSVERRWQKAVDTIIKTNFAEYEQFIGQKVNRVAEEKADNFEQKFRPIIQEWADEFNVSNLRSISAKLYQNFRVGKVAIGNVGLLEVRDTSLAELYELNDLQIDHDIDLYVPQLEENLIEEMGQFFRENLEENTRGRIGAIRISDGDSNRLSAKESFIPNNSLYYMLSFDLIRPISGQSVTILPETTIPFTFRVSFKDHPIDDSSLIYWIQHEKLLQDTASFKDGDISFPILDNMPERYKRQKLEQLWIRLDNMISNAGPANLTVTIVGMEVPGLIFVLASPISLFILSWFFLINLTHLANLAQEAPTLLRQFAWMPLMLEDWTVPTRHNGRSVPLWAIETVLSAILLPIASLCALHFQMCQFKSVAPWQTFMFVCIAIAIFVLGRRSTLCIGQIRCRVSRVKKVCQKDTTRKQNAPH